MLFGDNLWSIWMALFQLENVVDLGDPLSSLVITKTALFIFLLSLASLASAPKVRPLLVQEIYSFMYGKVLPPLM